MDEQVVAPDSGAVVAPEPAVDVEQASAPASLDNLFPDSEDIDEALRGKPIKEASRLIQQWRHEASTAAAKNRESNAERVELARTMLALQRQPQQIQQAPPQHVYVADGQGNAVAQPFDALIRSHVEPLYQQIEAMGEQAFVQQSESARERARVSLGIDADLWDELRPQFGMYFGANRERLDSRNPQHWVEAAKAYVKQSARLSPKTTTPAIPPPPVGNATSQGARPAAAPARLTAQQLRDVDEIAEQTGLKKGSAPYNKLIKEYAADLAAGGYTH